MRIKKLSPLVASQIAAGEVIERPASVLKELLENSVDAGSDIIDIELEQGGVRLIRVRDNGCGIYKDDLELALMQHATSKISTTEDLEEINSLGFRGEALASIAAVSQLELVSKPQEQEMGWEFKLADNIVQPASHHDGTTISVKNLFHNIPARRKFLRSIRTEFNYLEELFKRIALSQFNIAFSLTNDEKKIKQLPACQNEVAKAKRLAILCGNRMLAQSIYIDAEQNGLHLCGWLGTPEGTRRNSENQFFYINNRMVKDKLINHAIKQAYQFYCEPSKYPTYCLYFTIDIKTLDVNVHPTKHEVRFRDARVVHAFLTKVIQEALDSHQSPQPIVQPSAEEFTMVTRMPLKIVNSNLETIALLPTIAENKTNIKILCIIENNKLIFAEKDEQIILVDVKATKDKLLINEFEQLFFQKHCIPAQALLMPQAITFTKDVISIMQHAELFKTLGFDLGELGATDLLIRAVPLPLGRLKLDYQIAVENLAKIIATDDAGFSKCIKLLVSAVRYPEHLSDSDAWQLVQNITSVAIGKSNREKSTFRHCNVDELREFIYK